MSSSVPAFFLSWPFGHHMTNQSINDLKSCLGPLSSSEYNPIMVLKDRIWSLVWIIFYPGSYSILSDTKFGRATSSDDLFNIGLAEYLAKSVVNVARILFPQGSVGRFQAHPTLHKRWKSLLYENLECCGHLGKITCTWTTHRLPSHSAVVHAPQSLLQIVLSFTVTFLHTKPPRIIFKPVNKGYYVREYES